MVARRMRSYCIAFLYRRELLLLIVDCCSCIFLVDSSLLMALYQYRSGQGLVIVRTRALHGAHRLTIESAQSCMGSRILVSPDPILYQGSSVESSWIKQ